jgi:hypothetical protein
MTGAVISPRLRLDPHPSPGHRRDAARAMSQETWRACVRAWMPSTGGAELLAVCDPECEIPPREWPESAPIRGAQAIWDFLVRTQDAWERWLV